MQDELCGFGGIGVESMGCVANGAGLRLRSSGTMQGRIVPPVASRETSLGKRDREDRVPLSFLQDFGLPLFVKHAQNVLL